jgi:hypothetical protein
LALIARTVFVGCSRLHISRLSALPNITFKAAVGVVEPQKLSASTGSEGYPHLVLLNQEERTCLSPTSPSAFPLENHL